MKEQYKPIVGITIGDPAGIGPEIILKALGEKHIYDECRPLVIGCVNVLKEQRQSFPNAVWNLTGLNLCLMPASGLAP